MNKKIILLSSIAFLMLFTAAVPVLAAGTTAVQTSTPFTATIIQVMSSPGTTTMTSGLSFIQNRVFLQYWYGTPWGNSLSGTATACKFLDTATYTGCAVLFTSGTFAAGTLQGQANPMYNGLGWYTYNGPTFSFTVGSISGTVITGTSYYGLLVSGVATMQGVGGTMKGLVESDWFNGVSIMSGPLKGVAVTCNTGWIQYPSA